MLYEFYQIQKKILKFIEFIMQTGVQNVKEKIEKLKLLENKNI